MIGWLMLLALFLILVTVDAKPRSWAHALILIGSFSVLGYVAGLHIGGHF